MNPSTYAQTLRAIGQGLEAKNISTFQLISSRERYLVRVRRSKEPSYLSILRKVFQPYCRNQTNLVTSKNYFIKFHFSRDDLQHLERQGQARRHDPSKTPDFYTLPQIMRTVGCYIDKKGGRLAWIDMDGKKITLRYDNEQRYKILEHHTIPSLYDMFVCMYLHRHRSAHSPS